MKKRFALVTLKFELEPLSEERKAVLSELHGETAEFNLDVRAARDGALYTSARDEDDVRDFFNDEYPTEKVEFIDEEVP